MSNEMELLKSQSLVLSGTISPLRKRRVGWGGAVFGWLERWIDREKGSTYETYALALREQIKAVNNAYELIRIADPKYQQDVAEKAAKGIELDIVLLNNEITESKNLQDKMMIEHQAFVEESRIKKEERRRSALSANQLLMDDTRILEEQIRDVDKDEELDPDFKEKLLAYFREQRDGLVDAARRRSAHAPKSE